MPVRTCCGCRRRAEKAELVRMVMMPAGPAEDKAATMPGRGAYICPGGECLEAAIKKGAINRALIRKTRKAGSK